MRGQEEPGKARRSQADSDGAKSSQDPWEIKSPWEVLGPGVGALSNSQFPWAFPASRSPGGKSPEEPLEAPRSS